MDKAGNYGLIITYTDGSRDQFKLPRQLDKAKLATIVEKLLTTTVVTLQLEGSLLVIPTVNIRNAELFPVPERLPEVVLRGVERVAHKP